MNLLEIAVSAPIRQTLTYGLPETLAEKDSDNVERSLIGRRVLVPLSGRKVTGYVLSENAEGSTDFKIRNIIKVLDSSPLFPVNLIPLFQWISNYYHYPLGEVIKAALPSGLSPKSVRYLELMEAGRPLLTTENTSLPEEVVSTLLNAGRLTVTATRDLLSSELHKTYTQKLIKKGALSLCESVKGDSVREKLETCYRLGQNLPDSLDAEESEQDKFTLYRKQLSVQTGFEIKLSEAKTLYYMRSLNNKNVNGKIPRKELTTLYSGAAQAVRSLKEKGLIEEEKDRVFRSPLGEQLEFFPAPLALTEEQEKVLAEILPAIESRCYSPFLLHGVTGAGKTEVYLQAAAATLSVGRSVLVIVPEIALATQLEAHFVSRFSDQVVLLHSGLSAAEKFDQWSLALNGQAKIVIGARSAIFAPLVDPGLIVVDEEHDGGLKQDDNLRYNGRDLAVVRARQQGAVVLLSSATPSVVSYHNALNGKYRLLTMEKRVGDRSLPHVTLIDLRNKIPGRKKVFSAPRLNRHLSKILKKGTRV